MYQSVCKKTLTELEDSSKNEFEDKFLHFSRKQTNGSFTKLFIFKIIYFKNYLNIKGSIFKCVCDLH